MAEIKSIERRLLSGSTNGRGIKITATDANNANTIHTTSSTAGEIDEVWLYCHNSGDASIELYLCLGGTTSPDDICRMTIPSRAGDVLVLAGENFDGGIIIKAYGGSANYLIIRGYVNRLVIE